MVSLLGVGYRIDRFIEAMFRKSADTLVFGTGTPVRIRTGAQERVILDRDVRTDQIMKLLAPIAGSVAPDLGKEGETRFLYDAPAGRVRVTATTRGDRMMAIVLPAAAANDDVMRVCSPPSRSAQDDDGPLDITRYFSESAVDIVAEVNRSMEDSFGGGATEAAPSLVRSSNSVSATGPALATPLPELARAAPLPEPLRAMPPPEPVVATPPPEPVVATPPPEPEVATPPLEPRRSRSDVQVAADEPAINRVLRDLVDAGGSDLHLTSGERPRIRKDGDISFMSQWPDPLTSAQIEGWVAEVAHEKAQSTFREVNDADFAHEICGVARFRMNWFRDRNGVGAVMRTIPSQVLTADQLNLPPAIRAMCELPKGLVVVTGPTGSGKSTTLAAMVDLINKSRHDHIITIEDPVEFVHQSINCLVNQREVHSHTRSFSAALRAALREDPDIVLVGELRDLETVHIAIETAETGHLVLGTLHTNTAASTVDRMIDQFPTDHQAQIRVMLSESLRGVVAQTLCKRKGGGRVACMEILVVNHAVANLIREGKTFQIASIMQTNRGIGMQTQTDHMLQLVRDDLVDPAEAVRKAVDPNQMKQVLERSGFQV